MHSVLLQKSTGSDGHDKPFYTKAITIIDNFKCALGNTDNPAISNLFFFITHFWCDWPSITLNNLLKFTSVVSIGVVQKKKVYTSSDVQDSTKKLQWRTLWTCEKVPWPTGWKPLSSIKSNSAAKTDVLQKRKFSLSGVKFRDRTVLYFWGCLIPHLKTLNSPLVSNSSPVGNPCDNR